MTASSMDQSSIFFRPSDVNRPAMISSKLDQSSNFIRPSNVDNVFFRENKELQNLSIEVSPCRVEDRERLYCVKCKVKFNPPFEKRHHCRCCGDIYCGKCSDNKIKMTLLGEEYKKGPVRVCDHCNSHLSQGDINSPLRYAIILKSQNSEVINKIMAARALHLSVEHEPLVADARPSASATAQYPALTSLITQIGGLDALWNALCPILDCMNVAAVPMELWTTGVHLVNSILCRSEDAHSCRLFVQARGVEHLIRCLRAAIANNDTPTVLSVLAAIEAVLAREARLTGAEAAGKEGTIAVSAGMPALRDALLVPSVKIQDSAGTALHQVLLHNSTDAYRQLRALVDEGLFHQLLSLLADRDAHRIDSNHTLFQLISSCFRCMMHQPRSIAPQLFSTDDRDFHLCHLLDNGLLPLIFRAMAPLVPPSPQDPSNTVDIWEHRAYLQLLDLLFTSGKLHSALETRLLLTTSTLPDGTTQIAITSDSVAADLFQLLTILLTGFAPLAAYDDDRMNSIILLCLNIMHAMVINSNFRGGLIEWTPFIELTVRITCLSRHADILQRCIQILHACAYLPSFAIPLLTSGVSSMRLYEVLIAANLPNLDILSRSERQAPISNQVSIDIIAFLVYHSQVQQKVLSLDAPLAQHTVANRAADQASTTNSASTKEALSLMNIELFLIFHEDLWRVIQFYLTKNETAAHAIKLLGVLACCEDSLVREALWAQIAEFDIISRTLLLLNSPNATGGLTELCITLLGSLIGSDALYFWELSVLSRKTALRLPLSPLESKLYRMAQKRSRQPPAALPPQGKQLLELCCAQAGSLLLPWLARGTGAEVAATVSALRLFQAILRSDLVPAISSLSCDQHSFAFVHLLPVLDNLSLLYALDVFGMLITHTNGVVPADILNTAMSAVCTHLNSSTDFVVISMCLQVLRSCCEQLMLFSEFALRNILPCLNHVIATQNYRLDPNICRHYYMNKIFQIVIQLAKTNHEAYIEEFLFKKEFLNVVAEILKEANLLQNAREKGPPAKITHPWVVESSDSNHTSVFLNLLRCIKAVSKYNVCQHFILLASNNFYPTFLMQVITNYVVSSSVPYSLPTDTDQSQYSEDNTASADWFYSIVQLYGDKLHYIRNQLSQTTQQFQPDEFVFLNLIRETGPSHRPEAGIGCSLAVEALYHLSSSQDNSLRTSLLRHPNAAVLLLLGATHWGGPNGGVVAAAFSFMATNILLRCSLDPDKMQALRSLSLSQQQLQGFDLFPWSLTLATKTFQFFLSVLQLRPCTAFDFHSDSNQSLDLESTQLIFSNPFEDAEWCSKFDHNEITVLKDVSCKCCQVLLDTVAEHGTVHKRRRSSPNTTMPDMLATTTGLESKLAIAYRKLLVSIPSKSNSDSQKEDVTSDEDETSATIVPDSHELLTKKEVMDITARNCNIRHAQAFNPSNLFECITHMSIASNAAATLLTSIFQLPNIAFRYTSLQFIQMTLPNFLRSQDLHLQREAVYMLAHAVQLNTETRNYVLENVQRNSLVVLLQNIIEISLDNLKNFYMLEDYHLATSDDYVLEAAVEETSEKNIHLKTMLSVLVVVSSLYSFDLSSQRNDDKTNTDLSHEEINSLAHICSGLVALLHIRLHSSYKEFLKFNTTRSYNDTTARFLWQVVFGLSQIGQCAESLLATGLVALLRDILALHTGYQTQEDIAEESRRDSQFILSMALIVLSSLSNYFAEHVAEHLLLPIELLTELLHHNNPYSKDYVFFLSSNSASSQNQLVPLLSLLRLNALSEQEGSSVAHPCDLRNILNNTDEAVILGYSDTACLIITSLLSNNMKFVQSLESLPEFWNWSLEIVRRIQGSSSSGGFVYSAGSSHEVQTTISYSDLETRLLLIFNIAGRCSSGSFRRLLFVNPEIVTDEGDSVVQLVAHLISSCLHTADASPPPISLQSVVLSLFHVITVGVFSLPSFSPPSISLVSTILKDPPQVPRAIRLMLWTTISIGLHTTDLVLLEKAISVLVLQAAHPAAHHTLALQSTRAATAILALLSKSSPLNDSEGFDPSMLELQMASPTNMLRAQTMDKCLRVLEKMAIVDSIGVPSYQIFVGTAIVQDLVKILFVLPRAAVWHSALLQAGQLLQTLSLDPRHAAAFVQATQQYKNWQPIGSLQSHALIDILQGVNHILRPLSLPMNNTLLSLTANFLPNDHAIHIVRTALSNLEPPVSDASTVPPVSTPTTTSTDEWMSLYQPSDPHSLH